MKSDRAPEPQEPQPRGLLVCAGFAGIDTQGRGYRGVVAEAQTTEHSLLTAELMMNHSDIALHRVRSSVLPRRAVGSPPSLDAVHGATPVDGRAFTSKGASPVQSRPILFVVQGPQLGTVVALHGPSALVGRRDDADLLLSEDTVGAEHARILRDPDGVYIEDLASGAGTFLNDERITGWAKLADGDKLRFGTTTLVKFSMVDELEERALLTLFELTLRDPLTRLYNRRYFDRRAHDEFSFAQRHGTTLAVLLIDIDHFKRVNDEFGHPVGDAVLEVVANCIQKMMRPEDVLARYGGEEFIVLARSTSPRNAEILGERIRRSVQNLALDAGRAALRITVSVGVAGLDSDTQLGSCEQLVAAADSALYVAKRAGRNRISAAPAQPLGVPPTSGRASDESTAETCPRVEHAGTASALRSECGGVLCANDLSAGSGMRPARTSVALLPLGRHGSYSKEPDDERQRHDASRRNDPPNRSRRRSTLLGNKG